MTKPKKTTKAKMSREESRKRQVAALKMHNAGKTNREIMLKLGFANLGHTWNAIKRAREVAGWTKDEAVAA